MIRFEDAADANLFSIKHNPQPSMTFVQVFVDYCASFPMDC